MHSSGKSVLMKYFVQVGFCLHTKIRLRIPVTWNILDTSDKLSTYTWSNKDGKSYQYPFQHVNGEFHNKGKIEKQT